MIRHLNPPRPGLAQRAVTASAHDRARDPPAGLSEQITHASHRYLLPVVGAAAGALGAVAMFGRSALARPYVPWALVGLGAAAVASSAAFHHWQLTRRARVAASANPLPNHDPFPSPFPGRLSALAEAHAAHGTMPHSGLGRAAVSAAAGDRAWKQWESPPSAPLGVALAGPVPETAYVPPRGGADSPFAARDRDLQIAVGPALVPVSSSPPSAPLSPAPRFVPAPAVRASSQARARLAARRRIPFSDAELDAMFPPEAAIAPSLPLASAELSPIPFPRPALSLESEAMAPSIGPAAPISVTLGPARPALPPTAGAHRVGVEAPSGRFRILPSLISLRDPLYVETIHPIPPHLRSAPGSRGGTAPARRANSTIARGASASHECVGCLRHLSGFRGWVLCPGCHQALCRRCLGASFLASSEGYCSTCRPWHVRAAN